MNIFNILLIILLVLIIIAILNNNKNLFTNIINRKTIVFSLTCHESPECIIDLIENISICFRKFNIYILISTTENINNIIESKISNVNIRIITVRDPNVNIWGDIELFNQHIMNIEYLIKNDIKYDYFWFVASNEMFIRDISPFYLENIVIKKPDRYNYKYNEKDVDNYYKDLNETSNKKEWMWFKEIIKDEYLINIFIEEKIIIDHGFHEGMVLDKKLIEEIYNFFIKYEFIKNSKSKKYVMEEIFIYSYIKSKYNINTFKSFMKFTNNSLDPEIVLMDALNNPQVFSIKPVPRIYDHKLRKLIRESLK